MNRKLLAAILLIAAIALGYAAWSFMPRTGGQSRPTLTVFCAAGLKKPVEAIAQQYREEFGIEVNLDYGGTGTLLSRIQVAKKGDLFIAADDGSLADARKLKLIQEVVPIVVQHPVVAVKKGNAKNIHALADLNGSVGLFRLKEELTRRVNAAISPNQVNAVLFKEIVIQ